MQSRTSQRTVIECRLGYGTIYGVTQQVLGGSRLDWVVMIHGKENTAVAGKTFVSLGSRLYDQGVSHLRFDAPGCGMSPGDFEGMTVARRAYELSTVMKQLSTWLGATGRVFYVAHSLGAAVLDRYLACAGYLPVMPAAVLLVAPALDMRGLMRYWFACGNNVFGINWMNFLEKVSEDAFTKECGRLDQLTRSGELIGPGFAQENMNTRYGAALAALGHRVKWVHGTDDKVVPRESVTMLGSASTIVVRGGDHDLAAPEMRDQWVNQAAEWIAGWSESAVSSEFFSGLHAEKAST